VVLAIAAIAGSTAGGLPTPNMPIGGTRPTRLGTAVMFAGVLLIPSSFGLTVTVSGGYALAYSALAMLATANEVLLCVGPWSRRAAPV
jgi:hypothetical protein